MSSASSSAISVMRAPARSTSAQGLSRDGDMLYMLALRFIAHLSYFKITSAVLLPQGLATLGVVLATAVYALGCLSASRWIAGLRRAAARSPHPAVVPLLGTTAVFIAMMVTGPVIATLLPRHPEAELSAATLLPAWLALLAPACTVFFAAQLLTTPRRNTR